jgi:hypothetical protein
MDCPIIMYKTKNYQLHVVVHVMLHLKCFQEMIMMGKLVMFGHWESFFMEWYVELYHLSNKILKIFIKE